MGLVKSQQNLGMFSWAITETRSKQKRHLKMAGLSKNSPDVFTNFSQFEQLKKKKKTLSVQKSLFPQFAS